MVRHRKIEGGVELEIRKPGPKGANTQEKIIHAAERLFAERGYDSASVRDITAAADVDTALINYYFGNKENLFIGVLAYRGRIMSRDRLKILTDLRLKYDLTPIPIDILVAGFLHPFFERLKSGDKGWQYYSALVAQTGHSPKALDYQEKYLNPVAREFVLEFSRSMPAVPIERLYWQFILISGALMPILSKSDRLRMLSKGLCRIDDFDIAQEEIQTFILGGLEALGRQCDGGAKTLKGGKRRS